MTTKIREHLDAQFDDMAGRVIESVHVRHSVVLFLLSGDAYATVEAGCDDDDAYVETYEQHSEKWLLYGGFAQEFLTENRLLTAAQVERIENEKKEREARTLKEEREEYEKLKAKFEMGNHGKKHHRQA